jgi:hypothetical protein
VLEEFQAAMERRDPGAVFDSEAATDDFEWIVPDPGFERTSVWRGREGFVEFVRTWTEEFEDCRFGTSASSMLAMTELSCSRTSRQPEKRVGRRSSGRTAGLGAERWTRRSGEELSITPTPSKPPGCRGNHAIRPV